MTDYTPQLAPAPRKSRKVLRGLGWTAALFLSFTLGAGMASGGETTTAEPLPAETVTKTKTKTETVTKTVEVTPAACITAIERADEALYLAGEGFGASAAAMEAASMFDVAGIDAATADMVTINEQMLLVDYRTPADECMAGAR